MVPEDLEEWNINTLTDLLTKGYFESEDFDFKERLPQNNDETGKARLVKTCCAFANSGGGFLIFGVSNDTSTPIQNRLVGIDPNVDFPEHFGSYPQKCTPNVQWNFKNPPIILDGGNVIHVIHILQSWSAPHSFEVASDGRCFAKRTNKGNEPMSYEEIRMAFLQFIYLDFMPFLRSFYVVDISISKRQRLSFPRKVGASLSPLFVTSS